MDADFAGRLSLTEERYGNTREFTLVSLVDD